LWIKNFAKKRIAAYRWQPSGIFFPNIRDVLSTIDSEQPVTIATLSECLEIDEESSTSIFWQLAQEGYISWPEQDQPARVKFHSEPAGSENPEIRKAVQSGPPSYRYHDHRMAPNPIVRKSVRSRRLNQRRPNALTLQEIQKFYRTALDMAAKAFSASSNYISSIDSIFEPKMHVLIVVFSAFLFGLGYVFGPLLLLGYSTMILVFGFSLSTYIFDEDTISEIPDNEDN